MNMPPSENQREAEESLDNPTQPVLSLEELQQAYQSLRTLVNIVLVILLVLTGSLFLYLLRGVSLARRQVNELSQFVANYEKNSRPVMLEFRDKLQQFAEANSDFKTIFMKYLNTNPPPSSSNFSTSGPVRIPIIPDK